MSQYYDPDDDARPKSPGLLPFKPKVTPSPSPPPPFVLQQAAVATQNVSPPSSRRRGKPNRRKTKPSPGDFVLIRQMDPNRPDIARLVGERALKSDSDSEAEDEEVRDRSQSVESTSSVPARSQEPRIDASVVDLQAMAQKALSTNTQSIAPPPIAKPPPPFHRDSVVEADGPTRDPIDADTPVSQASSAGTLANGVRSGVQGLDLHSPAYSASTPEAASSNVGRERQGSLLGQGSLLDVHQRENPIAASPGLAQLTIPQSRGPPSEKLPALQPPHSPPRDGAAASPNQGARLPGFRHFSDLAEIANHEQNEVNRANGYAHRPSISSSTHSPTSVGRHLSMSSRSPASAFPTFPASPSSANSETTSRDLFLRSGQSHQTLFGTRRPSQASEGGPYSGPLRSASLNESYQSSDGLSPGTLPTPIDGRGPRMSIDGALTTRTLPPPNGPLVQHIPPHGAGVFKCDHPGCNAPPFQTQYLLNSHANVHSQSRPHYCPVSGCPRAEGGKGFKRKNEMIRHGLVHQSPGYVCPFCPDREHKYPRPDNLQRHVRVHHVDKDKDDIQLRDVLAQRPEGGSRGRRRRAGS